MQHRDCLLQRHISQAAEKQAKIDSAKPGDISGDKEKILAAKPLYRLEKLFAEAMALTGQDDPTVRQVDASAYILVLPHPTDAAEYVLCTWSSRKTPRIFADIGSAVNTALSMGATSIHFQLLTASDASK